MNFFLRYNNLTVFVHKFHFCQVGLIVELIRQLQNFYIYHWIITKILELFLSYENIQNILYRKFI